VFPLSEDASVRPKRHSMRRFLGGGALIALLTAVVISTAVFEGVSSIADALAKGGLIKSADLTPTPADAPTTFLILGSDRRAHGVDATSPPHSDTILLVHLDPRTGLWTEMSVPRDFYVQFSYHGSTYASKINYAYTLGGPRLSLHVVKDLLGIPINYVVDLNFESFDKVVDQLGCVYVDVDHQYLNTPAQALYDDYATINVRPGYQQLCGQHALDYVRYRHDDNTFLRDAREQAFLRDAKEQLGLSGLLSHAGPIVDTLSKSISSNIRGAATVAGMLETVINSVNGPVREVPFPDVPLDVNGQADQTASPAQIRGVVSQFLSPSAPAPVVHAIVAPHRSGAHHHASSGGGGSGSSGAVVTPAVPGLTATAPSTTASALALAVQVPFPIYVPALTLGSGSPDPFEPFSNYTLKDPSGHLHYGYRIDWSTGSVGSYYGIEGLNWTAPPMFAHADTIDRYGRRYLYVNTGSHVQDVGWIVGGTLYWVSNTLLDDLTNAQMFALAESAQPVLH
jgi:LCP family protein required for cell wall assembly